MQPKIVKTVNKWHAYILRYATCINVQCISFLRCAFSELSVLDNRKYMNNSTDSDCILTTQKSMPIPIIGQSLIKFLLGSSHSANSCLRYSAHTFDNRIYAILGGRARKMGPCQFCPTTGESLKMH
jgi:hypothetical protein